MARAPTPASIQRTYLLLLLGNTLAASFIWGINTIFLLDAGLSNLEAFAANAFFTAGMVLFEMPTGIVADTVGPPGLVPARHGHAGRHHAALRPAVADRGAVLGVGDRSRCGSASGFTFFSGAVEAWLVDALTATGFDGSSSGVRARARSSAASAMLVGSVAGGFIAQVTNLGVAVRRCAAVVLAVMFVVAFALMHDIGFTPRGASGRRCRDAHGSPAPRSSTAGGCRGEVADGARSFTGGVGIYVFYALQPYLLELYGDPTPTGSPAWWRRSWPALRSSAGFAAPRIRRLFRRRTSALLMTAALRRADPGADRRARELLGRDRADRACGGCCSRRRCRSARPTSTG